VEGDVEMTEEMSEASTQGVRVRVAARYHPERSDPPQKDFFFSYTVTITNEGADAVQLLSRHWVITDATGHVEHVRGPGVVGQQPLLKPGESFEYTSACPLPTSLGSMHGTYEMRRENGTRFEAEIAPFTLADPDSLQ
jgi:ApaG protein